MCGDPYCCNNCDHANGLRRFGQVWMAMPTKTLWMLVCPNTEAAYGRWTLLYIGTEVSGAESYWASRMAAGRGVLDSMSLDIGEWRLMG